MTATPFVPSVSLRNRHPECHRAKQMPGHHKVRTAMKNLRRVIVIAIVGTGIAGAAASIPVNSSSHVARMMRS